LDGSVPINMNTSNYKNINKLDQLRLIKSQRFGACLYSRTKENLALDIIEIARHSRETIMPSVFLYVQGPGNLVDKTSMKYGRVPDPIIPDNYIHDLHLDFPERSK